MPPHVRGVRAAPVPVPVPAPASTAVAVVRPAPAAEKRRRGRPATRPQEDPQERQRAERVSALVRCPADEEFADLSRSHLDATAISDLIERLCITAPHRAHHIDLCCFVCSKNGQELAAQYDAWRADNEFAPVAHVCICPKAHSAVTRRRQSSCPYHRAHYCDFIKRMPNEVRTHVEAEHGGLAFPCDHCPSCFRTAAELAKVPPCTFAHTSSSDEEGMWARSTIGRRGMRNICAHCARLR
jgi:hypothetical protein